MGEITIRQRHPFRKNSMKRFSTNVTMLQGVERTIRQGQAIHASWLNQIEIYFSIIQRKVLTPNDFSSRQELADRLLAFERYYETIARPFEWRFTRHDLTRLLRRLGHPAVKAA
jgi:hypothetical protein